MDCRGAVFCLVTFACLSFAIAKPVPSGLIDAINRKFSTFNVLDTSNTDAQIVINDDITDFDEPTETAVETTTARPLQTEDETDDDDGVTVASTEVDGGNVPFKPAERQGKNETDETAEDDTDSKDAANGDETTAEDSDEETIADDSETDETTEDDTDNKDAADGDETTAEDSDDEIIADDSETDETTEDDSDNEDASDGDETAEDSDDETTGNDSETGETTKDDDMISANANAADKLTVHDTSVELFETYLKLSLGVGVELDAIVTKGCNKFKSSLRANIAAWLLKELKQYYPSYSWNLFVGREIPASLQYDMYNGRYKATCNENEYEIWFNVGDSDDSE